LPNKKKKIFSKIRIVDAAISDFPLSVGRGGRG